MKSNRREFLRGHAVVDALAKLPKNLKESVETRDAVGMAGLALPESEASGYLTKIGRRAMACEFEVLLNAGQYTIGTEAALAALDLVDHLESQLTVFRNSSKVSRINQTAHAGPVEVEPQLFELLAQAAKIHTDTAGAYDIATGPLTKLWGFFRRQGRMPDAAELDRVMQYVGMQHVELDHQRRTVRYLTPGVEINLGSIGKGYALDRMADLLAGERIEHFLLHGGNSSVLGRGAQGQGNPSSAKTRGVTLTPALSQREREESGWWIGLRHPLEPERRIGEVLLCNRALGTSGSGTQFFMLEGRRYGHILDPRTGQPAEATLSTTVAAPTGAEADALATAFYVLGAESAIEYCRQHSSISAVIMSPAAESGKVEITLSGWGEDEIHIDADESLAIQRIGR
jgi:thiamine biosynthesis lipoprotein